MKTKIFSLIIASMVLFSLCLSGQTAEKLPGGVTSRLKKMDVSIQKAESTLSRQTVASEKWRYDTANAQLDEAVAFYDEILKGYAQQVSPDHPEIKSRLAKIEEVRTHIATSAQVPTTTKTQNGPDETWLSQARAFVSGQGTPYYNPKKYLIGSGTLDIASLLEREAICREAKNWLESLEKAYPDATGFSDELARAVETLKWNIQGFETGLKDSVDQMAAEIDTPLTQLEAWLEVQKNAVENGKKPLFPDVDQIQNIRAGIQRLSMATHQIDDRIQGYENRLKNAENTGQELRSHAKDLTRMESDQYQASDAAMLKTKAEQVAKTKSKASKVLRTVLCKKDWKEESVWEYTDSTRTAMRFRQTRSMIAQVAAKNGSVVTLYTIYLAQDKTPSGDWGDTYGHVMWEDPMIESNVSK